jgi:hypothetical protein
MFEPKTFIAINEIIRTMKKHIALMEKCGMFAEAMETEIALGVFLEYTRGYKTRVLNYEAYKHNIEEWEKQNE